jgi:hypothetical protein
LAAPKSLPTCFRLSDGALVIADDLKIGGVELAPYLDYVRNRGTDMYPPKFLWMMDLNYRPESLLAPVTAKVRGAIRGRSR